MKKANDIGLEHIMKLHISACRNEGKIKEELAKKYGEKKAKEILIDFNKVLVNDGPLAIYDVKNRDYDTAMIFSGSYDADIVRKACNWVDEHREVFGNEILEIGCDCGFMTTFLGSQFPEKHITAIDINQSGLDIAKKNAELFGLTNVEFKCINAMKLAEKNFDTVFSMRTMHENFIPSDMGYSSNELVTQANIYTKIKQPYADRLSSLLKDNGKLVSIERIGRDAMFLAWIQALTNAGLKIDLESYAELKCMEVGDLNTFEALLFSKEDASDVDVFESFMNCFANCIDIHLPKYEGDDAKVMYEFTRGKLIYGVELLDTNTFTKNRFGCWMHKYDNTAILCYQNNNGITVLSYHDISLKDECIKSINKAVEEAKKTGCLKVTELEI